MNNRTTLVLGVITATICIVIAVGYMASRPTAQPQTQPAAVQPLPSKESLATKLALESKDIHDAITAKIPEALQLYTLEREQLYEYGQWYGALLQYKGGDVTNRDTLRIVMKKEKNAWIVKTTPPQLLVSAVELPDAPISMLNDINRPAPLKGTDNSPTINPNE